MRHHMPGQVILRHVIPWQARSVPTPTPAPVSDAETAFEPMYRVIIHNDDVTPMDFVVFALERFFQVTGPAAVEIMFTAHFNGQAYVQTLPKSEAARRIGSAQFAAAMEGYPLKFTMERE